MDSYLLKCEETGIEALLVSIPTTSKLFSKITPHESTDPELEATLVEEECQTPCCAQDAPTPYSL